MSTPLTSSLCPSRNKFKCVDPERGNGETEVPEVRIGKVDFTYTGTTYQPHVRLCEANNLRKI